MMQTGKPRIALLNPNATEQMTDDMVASAQSAVGSAASVIGFTNFGGPASIQGPEDAELCLNGLFKLFDRACSENVDAVIVGCFDDTGLTALRARNVVPVIGLGEAGCIMGSLAAPHFAVVTTLDVSVPVIRQNIEAMGLSHRCATVDASGVPVLEVSAGPTSVTRVAEAIEQAVAVHRNVSIVLGCGGMTVLAPQLSRIGGIKIIDPVRAAAHLSLSAVSQYGSGSVQAEPDTIASDA